jgi:hypothetical protein
MNSRRRYTNTTTCDVEVLSLVITPSIADSGDIPAGSGIKGDICQRQPKTDPLAASEN